MARSAQVAMFNFTLSNGQGIGPSELKELWMKASGVNSVSVSRRATDEHKNRTVYTLYGPQNLHDVREIGKGLCLLLEAKKLNAKIVPLSGQFGD